MKKYFYTLLFITSFVFMGCSNLLDLDSKMSINANSPMESADVDKMLNGVYRTVLNPNDYSYFLVMAPEILSDNLVGVKFQWYQIQYLYEHKTPADDIMNGYFYPYIYKAIAFANNVIKTPSASESQIAQAKYCRAYSYQRLLDLYGAVPWVDENYAGEEIRRSTPEVILRHMIDDLVYAKQYAPEYTGDNTSPTKEAATALLARYYRMQGDLNKAKIEAEELINSGKFPLASDPKKELSAEIIMNFVTPPSTDYSYGEWGWIMSPDAVSWNCFAMHQDVVKLLSDTDKRSVFFDKANQAANNGYVFPTKYAAQNSDADYMISRIAEMYLISAEAGNAVRLTEFQSKRGSNLSIENERRLEFAGEFLRWNDLTIKGESYRLPIPKSSVDANPALKEEPLTE